MGGETRHLRPALLAALLTACALSALLPSPALAALFDPDEWLKGLMADLVGPRIDDVNRCIAQLTGLSGQGSLANPLTSLFGDEVGRQVYDVATTVMNVIMKPIAGTILAFCLVGQLIKTSQHVNPSSTFPGVMEVAGTLVFFVFFSLAIGYTEQVVALFFETGRKVLNVVNQTASIVAGPAQAVGNIDKEAVLAMVSDPGAGLSIWAEFCRFTSCSWWPRCPSPCSAPTRPGTWASGSSRTSRHSAWPQPSWPSCFGSSPSCSPQASPKS